MRLEHGLEEPAQQAAVVDGLLGLHVDELHVAAEALAHVARDLADGVDQADLDSRAARVDGAVEEPRAPVLVRLRVRVRVRVRFRVRVRVGLVYLDVEGIHPVALELRHHPLAQPRLG